MKTDETAKIETVSDCFDMFRKKAIHPACTPAQVEAAKTTFYAGAWALIQMIDAGHNCENLFQGAMETTVRMIHWKDELRSYLEGVQRRAAERN